MMLQPILGVVVFFFLHFQPGYSRGKPRGSSFAVHVLATCAKRRPEVCAPLRILALVIAKIGLVLHDVRCNPGPAVSLHDIILAKMLDLTNPGLVSGLFSGSGSTLTLQLGFACETKRNGERGTRKVRQHEAVAQCRK